MSGNETRLVPMTRAQRDALAFCNPVEYHEGEWCGQINYKTALRAAAAAWDAAPEDPVEAVREAASGMEVVRMSDGHNSIRERSREEIADAVLRALGWEAAVFRAQARPDKE